MRERIPIHLRAFKSDKRLGLTNRKFFPKIEDMHHLNIKKNRWPYLLTGLVIIFIVVATILLAKFN